MAVKREFFRVVSVLVFMYLAHLPAGWACETIRFKTGTYGSKISGILPSNKFETNALRCFYLTTNEEQSASNHVSGKNVSLTIEGIVEAQTETDFNNQKIIYEIIVA